MLIYKLPECTLVSSLPKGCAVCLGNFDGVHRGHRKLFDSAKDLVRNGDCPFSAVFAFTTLAKPVFSVPFITDNKAKLQLFGDCGLDYAILEDFDRVRDLDCNAFVSEYLISELCAGAVLCGFNYSFAKGGAGNPTTLSELLAPYGVKCRVIDAVEYEGQIISSSAVRKLICEGDMEGAAALLGHPFSVCFPVCRGKQLGRTIGIPTINQTFPEGHIVPRKGIYACTCFVDGEIYLGVANIGTRPTVSDTKTVNCETHIINYAGDLYGREIRVEFYRRIRDEIKFPSIEALRSQISSDISTTLDYFSEKYGG